MDYFNFIAIRKKLPFIAGLRDNVGIPLNRHPLAADPELLQQRLDRGPIRRLYRITVQHNPHVNLRKQKKPQQRLV
jgi:hypothetical protein